MLPITKMYFKYLLITLLKLINHYYCHIIFCEHFVVPLVFSFFISNKALKKNCKCVRSLMMITLP